MLQAKKEWRWFLSVGLVVGSIAGARAVLARIRAGTKPPIVILPRNHRTLEWERLADR